MKNKYQRYAQAKKDLKFFERELLFHDNQSIHNLLAFYDLKLNLEKSQRTVKNIRNILAARCKYWKTVCRYPVKTYEVLIIGFADDVLFPFDLEFQFPQKCQIYTKYWKDNHPPTIRVKLKHNKGDVVLGINEFKTGCAYQNKMIKKFAL